jgi:hypothetical protein
MKQLICVLGGVDVCDVDSKVSFTITCIFLIIFLISNKLGTKN